LVARRRLFAIGFRRRRRSFGRLDRFQLNRALVETELLERRQVVDGQPMIVIAGACIRRVRFACRTRRLARCP